MTERLSVFVVVLSMIAKSHLEPIVHGFAPRINIFHHSVQWLAAAMDMLQGFAHALISSIMHLKQHILNMERLYFNYVIRLSRQDCLCPQIPLLNLICRWMMTRRSLWKVKDPAQISMQQRNVAENLRMEIVSYVHTLAAEGHTTNK